MDDQMQKSKTDSVPDAISFIKESSFYKQTKYDWIRPLIDSLFIRKITEKDICSVCFDDDQKATEIQIEKAEEENDIPNKPNSERIVRIVKINRLENVGLLNQKDPIEFSTGLNIFYGPNGVGKSSIYTSLCKCLGKNKNLLPNLNKQNDESFCSITYVNDKGEENQLDWKTGVLADDKNIKIFDSAISTFIVDQDQINQFEIAHLKIEYFTFLHNLYERIEAKLIEKNNNTESKIDVLKAELLTKVPSIFIQAFELSKNNIVVKGNITQQELNTLSGLESNIKTLEGNNATSVIRNLQSARTNTHIILKNLGKINPIDSTWVQTIDKAYFVKINADTEAILRAQKILADANDKSALKSIPVGWPNSSSWQEFIDSALKYLHTLEHQTQEIYINEKCLLCQQILGQGAKELIQAYINLKKQHDDSLLEFKQKLQIEINKIQSIIDTLGNIASLNQTIIQELHGDKINSDFEKIKQFFVKVKKSMVDLKAIEVTDEELQLVQSFWTEYLLIEQKLTSNITTLEEGQKNQVSQLIQLKSELKPLKEKELIKANESKILELIDLKALKQKIDSRVAELATLKQQTSRSKSTFSQEMPLQLFQSKLDTEYKELGFKAPTSWSIKPITRDDINKRVYNLGDKRLSQIFSEGEKNIHSLADFFAEAEMNEYKGVYIFDDPVNSLDEINMDRVAQRILRLVEQGNQVIIFTHNIVFLNQLIDTEKEKLHKVGKFQNSIYIETDTKLGDIMDLKKALKKISEELAKLVSNPQPDDKIEFELRSIYGLISVYLESYLEVVLLKNVLNRFRPNIRMHKILELQTIEQDKLKMVYELYKQTDIKGIRHARATGNPTPKLDELKEHVESLNKNFSL